MEKRRKVFRRNKLFVIRYTKTFLALVLAVVTAFTTMPDFSIQAEAALGTLADATVLPATAGSTLSNGIYTVESNYTINNTSSGGNALKIADGNTVAIYIKKGCTLTVQGGNSTSNATGGGAAILVPSTSTLAILGEGTLIAKGGNGAKASNGDSGAKATTSGSHGGNYSGLYVYGGKGGNGGRGASGGGAAIGTNGAAGGIGGTGSTSNRYLDGSRGSYEKDQKGSTGGNGNTGNSSYKAGKIYVQNTVTIKPTAGSAGSYGSGGGYSIWGIGLMHDGWKLDLTASPGGGGGGGGSAAAASAVGAGGAGGGGGGAGGGGAVLYNGYGNGRYYGSGKPGSGGTASGGTGSTAYKSMKIDRYNGIDNWKASEAIASNWHDWYSSHGGTGGYGGARGSNGGCTDYRTNLPISSSYFNAIRSEITLQPGKEGVTMHQTSTYGVFGSALPTVSIPTKTGYTFNGYDIPSLGTVYKADGTSNLTSWRKKGDAIATAQWTPNNYVINFNRNGGGGAANKSVTFDATVDGLVAPIKAGYKFGGYYLGDISDNVQYFDEHMVYVANSDPDDLTYKIPDNITLNAKWTPIHYNIDLYSDFGNGAEWVGEIKDVEYGTFKLPGAEILDDGVGNIKTKNHCDFAGWNIYDQQTWAMYTPGKKYSGGLCEVEGGKVSIYAAWEPQDMKTLVYNGHGGTNIPDMAELYNDSEYYIDFTTVPEREGYTFIGWDESSAAQPDDCTYKVADAVDNRIQMFAGTEESHIGKNMLLYAVWKANPTVTYHTNEGFGTLAPTVAHKVGSTVTVNYTDIPKKTGYEFIGWNTKADGSGNFYKKGVNTSFVMPTDSVILYAQYKKEQKNLIINAPYFINDALLVKVKSGNEAIKDVELSPVFEGADDAEGETAINYGDQLKLYVYTAELINSENMLAVIGGSSLQFTKKSDTETIGAKEYIVYELTISNPVSDMEITVKDVDYYTYNISYDLDGGTLEEAPESFIYGFEQDLTSVTPEKEGYDFAGWKLNSEEGIVTAISANLKGNVTLTATYTAHKYDVTYETGISVNLWTVVQGNTVEKIENVDYDQPITVPTWSDKKVYINGIEQSYELLGFTNEARSTTPKYLPGSQISKLTTENKDSDPASVRGKVVLYAVWSAPTCSLSYYADGGVGNVPSSGTYTLGSAAPVSFDADMIPTKPGHEFDGWKIYGDTNPDPVIYKEALDGSEVTIDIIKDVVLAPNWKPLTYKIKYHGINRNDASSVADTDAIEYNESFILGTTNAASVVTSDNETLTDKYEIVTADNDTSSVDGQKYVKTDGTNYEVFDDTYKAAHPSWDEGELFTKEEEYKLVTGTVDPDSSDYYVHTGEGEEDTDYTAVDATYKTEHQGWKEITEFYYKTQSAGTRTHHLIGWSTTADPTDADSTVYATTQSVKNLVVPADGTEVVDLYAIWSYEDIPSTFTYVVFDVNGGKENKTPKTRIVSLGAEDASWTIDASEPPERDGYTFAGWALSAAKGSATVTTLLKSELPNNSTVTLHAMWTADTTYTVTFKDEKDTTRADVVSAAYEPGEVVNLKDIGPRASEWQLSGYTLNAWKEVTITTTTEEGETIENREEAILTCVPMTKNYVVYADWVQDPTQWKSLIYDSNGGDSFIPNPEKYLIGEEVEVNFESETTPSRSGYEFKGWSTSASATTAEYVKPEEGSPVPVITLTDSVVLYAVWDLVPTYSVVYDLNIEDAASLAQPVDTAKYEADSTVTVKFEPVAKRQGYTFLGWGLTDDAVAPEYKSAVLDENGDVVTPAVDTFTISQNTKLYAVWKPISYKVVLHSGDKSQSIEGITYGNDVNYIPAFSTLTGFESSDSAKEFDGWAISEDGGKIYEDKALIKNFSFTDGAIVDLYATWKNKKFTVTLMNDEDVEGNFEEEYEEGLSHVEIPVKEGFVFTGYNSASDGSGTAYYDAEGNSSLTMPAHDLILYAQWEAFTYTITYYGPTLAEIGSQVCGSQYSATNIKTVEELGYELPANTIFGWWEYTDGGNTIRLEDGDLLSKLPVPEVNYANFALRMNLVSDVEYFLSYNANGGLGGPDRTLTYPEDVPEEIAIDYVNVPTRKGYDFIGWDRSSSAVTAEFDYKSGSPAKFQHPNDGNSDKITVLYAVWAKKEVEISFDTDGGSQIEAITRSYGDEMGQLEEPTRQDYTFDGWYMTTDFRAKDLVEADTVVTSDADYTIYAKWVENIKPVEISFDSNGGSQIDSITRMPGDEMGQLEKPTRQDYTFDGWYSTVDFKARNLVEDDTVVTSTTNYTIYAKWIENKKGVPQLEVTSETVYGKCDGVISGIEANMEISVSENNIFVPVGSITADDELGFYNPEEGTISKLKAGTYFVRYKENASQSASEAAKASIGEGRKLKLTIPECNSSYTISAEATELGYGAETNITIYATNGDLFKTFELTATNGTLTQISDKDNVFIYHISNVTEDTAIEVSESTVGYNVIFFGTDGIEHNEYVTNYTGQKIEPFVHVYFANKLLREGVDYTVTYKNNIKIGNVEENGNKAPCVIITGKGSYTKSYTKYFTIQPISLKECTYVSSINVRAGEKVTPTIIYGGTLLTKSDYVLESKVLSATSTLLKVTGKGNFKDTIEIQMNSNQNSLRKIKVAYGKEKLFFNGQPQRPSVEVTDVITGKALTENVDYTIGTDRDCVSSGKHNIVVIGTGKYTGSVAGKYTIGSVAVSTPRVECDSTVEYSPVGAYPENIRVFAPNLAGEGEVELTYGRDYTLAFSKNKDAGEASYQVKFIGDYKGTKAVKGTYTITKGHMNKAKVVVPNMSTYKKAGVYISKPIVEYDGVEIKANMYTAKYYLDEACTKEMSKTSMLDLGAENSKTVYVKVVANSGKKTSNLEGEAEITSYVVSKPMAAPIDLSKAKITLVTTSYTYDGNVKEPEIVVMVKSGKINFVLEENQYDVIYACNTGVGKATVVVNGNGVDTTGSKSAGFKIGAMNLIDWFTILKK